jgi:hypothetical protein
MKKERGQALVEFALLTPVLFIFLFGVIDMGMLILHRSTLQYAVREGAHYATLHDDCEDIRATTKDLAGNAIDDSSTVSVAYEQDPAPIGSMVKVSAPFDWEFPLLARFGVIAIHKRVEGEAMLELEVTDAGGCGP